MTVLTADEIKSMAKARAGWRIHLIVYLVVNTFFLAIWALVPDSRDPTIPYGYWPIWPHMVWGVGLAIHGLVVYLVGPKWERREEERLRQKMT